MLDTTLVPEPSQDILKHRRHHPGRGFSIRIITRHPLATNVSVRGPERCECELTDRSPPWRAQRRHSRYIEEALATPLACQRPGSVRVGVMPENEAVVLRDTDVGLNSVGAELHSPGKGRNGILWSYEGSATVPNDVELGRHRTAGRRSGQIPTQNATKVIKWVGVPQVTHSLLYAGLEAQG